MPTLVVTKTYLDNNTLSETDLDNIKNSTESFFNSTKLDASNVDCDAVAQGMTSVGADAIAASSTSSAVTSILAAISTTEGYRVQGGSTSKLAFKAPLTATGSTISSFVGSSTTLADITGATVTVTARNRPILLQLQSTSTGTTQVDGTIASSGTASIFLAREGTIILGSNSASEIQPVSTISFIDLTPGTGSKVYKLQYEVDFSSLNIYTARLIAVEL